MPIPTEPIGSIPRPAELVAAWAERRAGRLSAAALDRIAEQAIRDTIRRFEETESTVVTDGEQSKPSFATYPLEGASGLAPDGVVIPFADGHTRQLPRLTAGPFRYTVSASRYLAIAKGITSLPVKQAVISASALSLLYPQTGIAGYSREAFVADVVDGAVAEIRQCLDLGADSVQIDFTEGRLSLLLDPGGNLLDQFIALNNQVLDRFSAQDRRRIGVHSCPGGDRDSTHSAGVDYAGLLPALFRLRAGRFYLQLASEPNPDRVLQLIGAHRQPDQMVFIGVTDPINPAIERPEQIRDRILLASRYVPVESLGTTDDCGFAPFADDASTSRDIAFAKVRARVEGTALAASQLALS